LADIGYPRAVVAPKEDTLSELTCMELAVGLWFAHLFCQMGTAGGAFTPKYLFSSRDAQLTPRGLVWGRSTRAFANKLFEGAVKDTAAIDELIVKQAENWRLERLAVIDRAILRLAIYELRTTDTPPKVILNEAVDLAKKFSSEEAGSFVNGILDAVHKSLATR